MPDGEAERANKFVASVLDPRGLERVAACERIKDVLAERRFTLAYQPIFDLRDGAVFAVEALARFAGEPYRGPDVWLAEAHDAGLGVGVELALLRAAIEQLAELPPDVVLTVNAGPDALAGADIGALFAGAEESRIVVELTEHAAVEDYPRLASALDGLRSAGVRLAIDDAGAGFASLMHILRLAPDFIKLDRQLISGLDVDPAKRSLAASLMRFGEESGATIVAEGVETAAELKGRLRSSGSSTRRASTSAVPPRSQRSGWTGRRGGGGYGVRSAGCRWRRRVRRTRPRPAPSRRRRRRRGRGRRASTPLRASRSTNASVPHEASTAVEQHEVDPQA